MNRPADWQLPPGVDRGVWDYLHSEEMVQIYDSQMAESELARADVGFCETIFSAPGRLVDLGCGTGRLAIHFAAKGYDCTGVDLSEEMLAKAAHNAAAAGVSVEWVKANLVDLSALPSSRFDYAACLFSTLGMVRGVENRRAVVEQAARLLKPGGRFVLHVHNRYFAEMGGKRLLAQFLKTLLNQPNAGDITMAQAYGGAPLTLHHFTRREALSLLSTQGLQVEKILPVDLSGHTPSGWPQTLKTYGYLIAAKKP